MINTTRQQMMFPIPQPASSLVTTKLGSEQAVVFRQLMPEIPSTTYATFGLYKYPAKFVPKVSRWSLL